MFQVRCKRHEKIITTELVELLEEKKADEESPPQKFRKISHQVAHAQGVDIWQIRKKND